MSKKKNEQKSNFRGQPTVDRETLEIERIKRSKIIETGKVPRKARTLKRRARDTRPKGQDTKEKILRIKEKRRIKVKGRRISQAWKRNGKDGQKLLRTFLRTKLTNTKVKEKTVADADEETTWLFTAMREQQSMATNFQHHLQQLPPITPNPISDHDHRTLLQRIPLKSTKQQQIGRASCRERV